MHKALCGGRGRPCRRRRRCRVLAANAVASSCAPLANERALRGRIYQNLRLRVNSPPRRPLASAGAIPRIRARNGSHFSRGNGFPPRDAAPRRRPRGLIVPRRRMRFVRHRCDVPNKESAEDSIRPVCAHGSHPFVSAIYFSCPCIFYRVYGGPTFRLPLLILLLHWEKEVVNFNKFSNLTKPLQFKCILCKITLKKIKR